MSSLRSLLWLVVFTVTTGCAAGPEPFADIHLHYNWDHEEVTAPAAAVATLREHNVVLGVVAGVPSDHAVKLSAVGGGFILPIFSPYIENQSRYNWFRDPRVLEQARQALASGTYVGIGEIHIGIGAYTDSPIFRGLLGLAREHAVPVLVHTDASDHRFFSPVCQEFADVRFLWAHAGALGPGQVEAMLRACPNVWVEFSARDPWHYGNFVRDDGVLPDAWRTLIVDNPERFMTGTDPVWNAEESNRWFEANQGWEHYAELIAFHRAWLAQLPDAVEERVRLTNALEFFGVEASAGN